MTKTLNQVNRVWTKRTHDITITNWLMDVDGSHLLSADRSARWGKNAEGHGRPLPTVQKWCHRGLCRWCFIKGSSPGPKGENLVSRSCVKLRNFTKCQIFRSIETCFLLHVSFRSSAYKEFFLTKSCFLLSSLHVFSFWVLLSFLKASRGTTAAPLLSPGSSAADLSFFSNASLPRGGSVAARKPHISCPGVPWYPPSMSKRCTASSPTCRTILGIFTSTHVITCLLSIFGEDLLNHTNTHADSFNHHQSLN